MLYYGGRYTDEMGILCIKHDIVLFICADRIHKVYEIYCGTRFCSKTHLS